MSLASAQVTQHSVYQKYIDLYNDIQKSRDELYDVCEKTHLLLDDINPSFQKDNSIAIESYNYAKRNYQTPYYKEILRVMGTFQKRINNAKIRVGSYYKSAQQNECCSICKRNIQIKHILLTEYFKQESEFKTPTIDSISSISNYSESLSSSISSIKSS